MASFQSDYLWKALAISAVVHGFLLAATWPLPAGTEGERTPLLATLRASLATAPVPDTPASARHPAVRHGPPAVASEAQEQPPLVAKPATDNSTAETSRRSEVAAGEGMASGAAAPVAPTPAGAALDAEGLRGYRLALAVRARQFKRYPARAVEAGWNGTAEVRVAVVAAGLAQGPELVRPSGHAALDEAALEMVRQAAAATPVPDSLRGRAFAVNLPVVFDLPN